MRNSISYIYIYVCVCVCVCVLLVNHLLSDEVPEKKKYRTISRVQCIEQTRSVEIQYVLTTNYALLTQQKKSW